MEPIPNDAVLLAEICRAIAAQADGTTRPLLRAYYGDLARADRTARPVLYGHLGALLGIVDRLTADRARSGIAP
jgi:hypothetical protein